MYPYLLRHTFARLFLMQSRVHLESAAYTLNKLMGHASMDMTLRYVHFFQADLAHFHGIVQPGDRF